MSDFSCYRFDSKEQFRSFAKTEALLAENDELITSSHTFSIDEIGQISKGGEWDPETGEVITPPTVLDGWHVNVTGDLAPEVWDPYLVVVNHPVRVFAGGATQAPDTPTLEEIVAS